MEEAKKLETIPEENREESPEKPEVLEEIAIEELAIDGICGVY